MTPSETALCFLAQHTDKTRTRSHHSTQKATHRTHQDLEYAGLVAAFTAPIIAIGYDWAGGADDAGRLDLDAIHSAHLAVTRGC